MLNGKKVVAILPAYNAAKTLKMTVDAMPKNVVDDIILVDDCSRDNTAQVSRSLGLKTFVHPKNLGYGGNQKTCYREASKIGADIVVMVHPDFQYDPVYIPQMVEPIANGECDAVFGSRMMVKENALKGGMPRWKFIANIFLTKIENFVLGMNLTEYHSGFRAYNEKVLSLPLELNSNDFVFDTEIIVQMKIAGLKIQEIPIATRYFPEASMIGFKRSVQYGLNIMAVMVKYLAHKFSVNRVPQLDVLGQNLDVPICFYCKSFRTEVTISGTHGADEIFRSRYVITEANSGIFPNIYKCQECDFYFADRRGLARDIFSYYKNQPLDFNYLHDSAGRGKSFRRVIRVIKTLTPSFPRKLLEIGSGPGIFLAQAEQKGFEVVGVDPSSESCRFARSKFGLNRVFEGDEDIIEKQFPDNYFDVVVALDVIEHVYDPVSFFATINKKLKPGGLFVLTTPIINSLTARILKKKWHALAPSHLNYFTYAFLEHFYKRFGYFLAFQRFYLRYLSVNYLIARLFHSSRFRVPQFLNFTLPINLFDEIEIYIRKK